MQLVVEKTNKIKTKLTPVRYPGGKSNALKYLDGHLIKDFAEYREPFFGGGSVGLYLMQINKDATYWINDLFYPVYCFWKVLYEQPETLVEHLLSKRLSYDIKDDIIPKRGVTSIGAEKWGRGLHTYCRESIQKTISEKDIFQTACYWYILNKTSYSGMAMIGSYAPLAWDQNFTENCIKNLPKTSILMHSVKNVKITNLDYSELLTPEGENVFVFLDPPYKIPHNLYGKDGDMHETFDHELFTSKVKECRHNWMITYNQDELIEKWFSDYRKISWTLTYTMKAAKRNDDEKADIKMKYEEGKEPEKTGKKGKELLILNYDNIAQER